MKLKHVLCLMPLGLAGCAGYNHTLFMTKSNVGLDFDSKPPTLEINISRKEAVIAPSFEGGKTPPVMASFKPSAGAGGSFGSFFMGVDQTFAGGDAALAMSQLYNQPTATDITKFNSELELSEKPHYTDPFRKIPDAGATRPLIFGTDTSLGLKVAWSGAGGQFPDTVKLGFNRKEFAWAPLSAAPKLKDGKPDGTKVNVKMPAFLATIESSQKLDTNGTRIEALQYFATGNAATYLAMRKEVRTAMHARLDPSQEKFQKRFGTNLPPAGRSVALSLVNLVYGELASPALRNNPQAAAHVQRLDSLMPAELEYDFIWYGYDGTAKNLQKQTTMALRSRSNNSTPFEKLNSYVTKLTDSIGKLETAVLDEGLASLDGTPIPANEKPAKRQQLYEELKSLQMKQRQILDFLDRHGSTLTDAVEFFYN